MDLTAAEQRAANQRAAAERRAANERAAAQRQAANQRAGGGTTGGGGSSGSGGARNGAPVHQAAPTLATYVPGETVITSGGLYYQNGVQVDPTTIPASEMAILTNGATYISGATITSSGGQYYQNGVLVNPTTIPASELAILNAPANGVTGTGDSQVLNETVNGVTSSLSFETAQQIIDSALQVVGLDPTQVAQTGVNQGQTLANYFWQQITSQGLTDAGTIGQMVTTLLPATGQFQVAFPGYQEALKNGYVRTVSQYVSAEEGMTGVMMQAGIPKSMINSTRIGNLIANGLSVNEVAQRVQNGFDAAVNAPAEVQNYFAQEFGAGQGQSALATVFLDPKTSALTLQKMLGGAEIQGAAAASNLPISAGLSQRLADMGETYSSAQAKFHALTNEAGLFQQTVGEQSSQAPVPGTQNANAPLSEADQGVAAAFGTSANAVQQVHQAALARQNEFRGAGGASTTNVEGFSGLASSKPF